MIIMKKNLAFLILTLSIIVCGCTITNNNTNNENGWSNYKWELIIQWVWPEISMKSTVEDWTLVLRWDYEDHADIIFVDQEMWQNYVDPHKMIYGNQVSFKWEIEQIDWAAGTHYYNATSIDTLEELFVVNDETEESL